MVLMLIPLAARAAISAACSRVTFKVSNRAPTGLDIVHPRIGFLSVLPRIVRLADILIALGHLEGSVRLGFEAMYLDADRLEGCWKFPCNMGVIGVMGSSNPATAIRLLDIDYVLAISDGTG